MARRASPLRKAEDCVRYVSTHDIGDDEEIIINHVNHPRVGFRWIWSPSGEPPCLPFAESRTLFGTVALCLKEAMIFVLRSRGSKLHARHVEFMRQQRAR